MFRSNYPGVKAPFTLQMRYDPLRRDCRTTSTNRRCFMKYSQLRNRLLLLAGILWLSDPGRAMAQTSGVLREVYTGIPGDAVSDLTNDPSYPSNPAVVEVLPEFEAPTDEAEEYGQRLSAYLIPPVTGSYVFWIASDDGSELYLSTDESPATKQLIASVPQWTNSREWYTYPEQESAAKSLTAGQRYYIEALMKEGNGGDNLAVAWQLPGGSFEGPIPGSRLQVFGLGPPQITQQPTNVTVVEGAGATFRVTLARAIGASYQWKRGAANINGATNSSHVVYPTVLADSGAQFSCFISNPQGNTNTATATLTVLPDLAAPTITSVGTLGDNTVVSVLYSEPVEPASATNKNNYSINGGAITITKASFGPDTQTVVLSTAPLSAGVVYTLTVNNVRDRATTPNTILANTQRTFSIDFTPVDISNLSPNVEPIGPSSRRTGLVISELMYHPTNRTDGKVLEFVELYNSQVFAENIGGYRLSGEIDFTFPTNTTIAAGGYLVIAPVPADVQSVYGITGVLGGFTNHLSNASGTVRLRSKAGAVLLEANYSGEPPWPVAADGAGHSLVLARPTYGEQNPEAWAASDTVGGTPGSTDTSVANSFRTVVINEFLAHTDLPDIDYIELYNYSSAPVNLTGCVITDDPTTNRYVINGSIPAKGYLLFNESALGFRLDAAGETIYLKSPTGNRIIDAIRFKSQENGVATGRYPDGAPGSFRLLSKTPGAANAKPAVGNIVINEIMYNPISGSSDDEFVELFNRGVSAVNLAGWKLSDAVSFTFPSNAVISSGGYLVVANQRSQLLTNHPGLNTNITFGNYGGTLGNSGERIALTMPDEVVTTNGSFFVTNIIHIEVDEVTFRGGGRWGKWADGGGSSLELKDAHSNHRLASNWADSDEGNRSAWTNIEYTGVLDHGNGNADSLQLFLQGAGECLVDSVEVFRSGGPNLVVNSDFEGAFASSWFPQGTHDMSYLENTGGYGGGKCLHVVASGRGDTGANRIRTMLTSTLSPDETVTLRAKVRWLKGNPEILLRLHGSWLEAHGNFLTTRNLGTPGAANSRATPNAGPAIHDVAHSPLIPAANQAVTIRAQVADPDGLASLVLKYRVDPSTNLTSVSMTYNGAGIYTGVIPGQGANTLVAFHIQSGDNGTPAVATTFPDDAPTRECLVRFGETIPNTGRVGTYRFWITQATNNRWTNREHNSNEPLDATFVYGNSRVVYNIGTYYSGSPWHTPGYNGPLNNMCDYVFQFPDDDQMLGTTDFVMASIGNLNSDGTAQREQAAFWMLQELGVPTLYRRFVNLLANGQQRGLLFEDAQQPGGEVVDEWFPDDNNGDLHKIEDWFEFDTGGDSKLFNVDATLENFTTTGGAKKLARYRWNWRKRAVNDSANDYTSLFSLVDALNSPQPQPYNSLVDSLVDIDEWARVFAVEHLAGNWDSYGYDRGKNMYAYKPTAGKWNLMAWDIDFLFDNHGNPSDTDLNPLTMPIGDPTIRTFLSHPAGQRAFWRALEDAANGPMVSATVSTMMNSKYNGLLNAGIAVGDPNGTLSYIADRRTFIQSELAAVAASFSITSNGGNNFSTGQNYLTLTGTAPVGVKTIKINGVAYPVTWTGLSTWTLNYALGPGLNVLTVQGHDIRGTLVSGSTDTISVTYTGTAELPQNFLVINEIMYNPAIPNASYVEIHNKSAVTAFDVSNFRIEGADFAFPEGTIVQPGGFLVIVNDPTIFSAVYGGAIPITGVFDGTLQNNGETLSLVKPGATPAQDILIDEVSYDDQPPWPTAADGFGPSLQLMDPNQDNNRVANWSAATTNAAAAPQWQYVTVTGTATASRLYVYLAAAGEVFLDDLQLVAGVVPEVGQNYVQNGNFEGALTGPWNLTANTAGSSISSATKRSGTGSLRLACNAAGSSQGDSIWQDFGPLVTNATYTLSYWYLPNTNGGTLTLRLSGSGVRSDQNILTSSGAGGSQYTPGAVNSVRTNLAAFPLVWLNEVQPNNVSGLQDDFGDRDPWVELYNSGASAIDLSGYYLGDNYTNLLRWAFPAGTTINSGQYLVVWLDGEPAETTGGTLHASFRIPATTGSVVLTRGVNPQLMVDYLNYELINNDRSYGAFPNGTPAKRQKLYYATPGQPNNLSYPAVPVSINEWMASNTGTLPDLADFNFDDWFELYNAGPTDIDLSGYRLTDNLTNTTQFTIPNGYSIPANGYLLVWADDDTGQNDTNSPDLHVNFKLGGSGEAIGLFAPNGTNVDSITFGSQTNDISQGRYPDGNSGLFYFMIVPTPRGPNTVGGASSNQPPNLNAIGNKSGNEGTAITFTASASDPNSGQTLTYSLDPGAPSTATINPGSGAFSWTPTEAQGPGTYPVTVRVTDNGSPAGSDLETISISVAELNTAPSLGFISDKNATEGVALSFNASATDPDLPAQTLTYSLDSGAPAGATINASSGLFTWTPTEAQGPGSYTISLRVTDSGPSNLSVAESFNISVAEANAAPVLGTIANTNVTELRSLNLTLTATDPDLPANTFTYAVVSGPTGASVNANSGLVSWTPAEAQGPSTNTFSVRVTDNGTPSLSSTQSFSVIVLESNSPPVFGTISDQLATPGTQLSVNLPASDSDIPLNTLAYYLVSGPAGASVNVGTGTLTWTPAPNQSPGTNLVTVRVTDNGSPAASGTNSFTVVVSSVAPLRLTGVAMSPTGNLVLTWDSQAGKVYQVEHKDSLSSPAWNVLGTYPATGASTSATNTTPGAVQRFYRVNQTN